MRQFLKRWILPISMLGGILFHDWIEYLKFLTPYLIFVMLTVTYTRISPREFKITRFHWSLLALQIVGCWSVYFAFYYINPIVAAGGFICVFVSTATSAPVITGMLGGNVTRLATYSFLSSTMVAILAPLFLTFIHTGENITFTESFHRICAEVLPLLILPIIVAMVMRYSFPKLHATIANHQSISFYIWAVALFIVMGSSISFIIKQPIKELSEMIGLALVSLVVCCLQFYIGRKVGIKYGDKISGAQGLGQKNTILAIWMALTYLNPIASIAPASYVVWQNIINSLQLYYKGKERNI